MNGFFSAEAGRHPLSLHHLTVLDAAPLELIDIAARLGCAQVGLFTFMPAAVRHLYPLVGPQDIAQLAEALAEAHVRVGNLEVFPLDRDDEPARFDEALATGAALGAQRATAHIHSADLPAATLRFRDFCDRAAGRGLKAGLEFNAFSAVGDAATAAAIVRAAGRANGEVALDMLHLVRSGGGPADVAEIADLVFYAQICDGPAETAPENRFREAIGDRMLPGEGAFPIAAILAALRPGTLIEVEVPQTAARKSGVSPMERARRAVEASRSTLAIADARRPA